MNFTIDPNAVLAIVLGILGGLGTVAVAWLQARARLITVRADLEAEKLKAEKQKVIEQAARDKLAADFTAQLADVNARLTATNEKLQATTVDLSKEIGVLRGSLDTERRVHEVLETRIQRAEEHKYEAYSKLAETERELEQTRLALQESNDALKKANELNQLYQATIKEHQNTIDKLVSQIDELTKRVTQLETDLKVQQASTAALQRDYASARYALRRYVELVPLRSTPPEFQADFVTRGIDLAALLSDPPLVHEPTALHDDTPVVGSAPVAVA